MNKAYTVIGTMSGTSLDGLDMACVTFFMGEGSPRYEVLDAATIPYDGEILSLVKSAIANWPGADLSGSDRQVAQWMGSKIMEFAGRCKARPLLISFHGQTIVHRPDEGLTRQLGDGRIIARLTGLPVVCNFRQQDIDLGGQGAPLVPAGDLILFRDHDYCLNLGGIANISHKNGRSIRAWDVCICNAAANHFAAMSGMAYDEGGNLGRAGKIIPELLQGWNSLEYFGKKGPKSLDAAFFRDNMQPFLRALPDLRPEDALRTLYHHIGFQIASSVEEKDKKILVSGGGAHNNFLLSLLKDEFGLAIDVPSDQVIDYKEAIVFGLLGLLRWLGEDNVFASVTGASADHCSGTVFQPFS